MSVTPALGASAIFCATLLIGSYVGSRTNSLRQTLTSLGVQVMVALTLYSVFGLVEDEVTYNASALSLVEAWSSGASDVYVGVGVGKESFTYILGFSYLMLGASPLPGLALNSCAMAFIPAIVSSSCTNLAMPRAASVASWLAALAPPLVLWAPGLRRESISFLLLGLTLLAMSLVFKGRFLSGMTLAVVVTAALSSTRSQLVVVSVAGIVASLVLSPDTRRTVGRASNPERTSVRRPIIGALISFALVGIAFVTFNLQRFIPSSSLNGYITELSGIEQNTRNVGASWETNSNPVMFAYNFFRMLWGPPMWEWRSMSMIAIGVDGLFYLAMTLLIVLAFRNLPRYRRQFVVLLASISPLLLSSTLLLSNYGLNSRIRAHCVIFVIPIVAAYLSERKSMKSIRLSSREFVLNDRDETRVMPRVNV
jgi:hypothetical protein